MNYNWPSKGDKLTFLTADGWFYPHFTEVIDFAKKNLSCGREYTVKRCEVYSSWCGVWLEEVEYEHPFHLPMFDWQERKAEKLKTQEFERQKRQQELNETFAPKP